MTNGLWREHRHRCPKTVPGLFRGFGQADKSRPMSQVNLTLYSQSLDIKHILDTPEWGNSPPSLLPGCPPSKWHCKRRKKMLVTSSSSKFKAIPEGLEARGCFPATSRCRIQLNGGGGGEINLSKNLKALPPWICLPKPLLPFFLPP